MTGFARRPLLGAAAVLEARGRVRGALYDFGEYPGLVLGGTGWVSGELYRIRDLAKRLPTLDRTEGYDPASEAGSSYVRQRVAVLIGDGSTREAWVYVYNGPPERGPRVESGDWRAHVVERGAVSG
ncbi:MAG: gamma-glutamylcyclotransferase [Candidatus Rokubacteria bacterium]|nr:gamma-glutamylcyclotransferase [Candidatus Rokubacteria bacterium]